MRLKMWFYRGGTQPGWLVPSTGVRPRCTRKAGERLGR